jgi:hypothetical protein
VKQLLFLTLLAAGLFSSSLSNASRTYYGLHPGALEKENLEKKRPAPPFNLTGTWNFIWEDENGAWQFLPLPKLTPAAEAELKKREEYAARGLEYRDDPAACWPLGVPRIMTRVWPIQIIQLPTMVQMTAMFNNSIRWIYTDGRKHPPEDLMVPSFNGHSIGKWEGDTLVVDTTGFGGDHHWIQEGIPASDQLHVVERIRMVDDGKGIEIEFTMTDPVNWEGQWENTKRFARTSEIDIEEHLCIYEEIMQLPDFEANIRE